MIIIKIYEIYKIKEMKIINMILSVKKYQKGLCRIVMNLVHHHLHLHHYLIHYHHQHHNRINYNYQIIILNHHLFYKNEMSL
jgi:hypothetical protein